MTPPPELHSARDAERSAPSKSWTPLERLFQAVLSSAHVDDLLRAAMALFIEVTGADAGVVRLIDAAGPRSRASVGLKDDGAVNIPVPCDDGGADGMLIRVPLQDPKAAEVAGGAEVEVVYWLCSRREASSFSVCLGCRRSAELAPDQCTLLEELAAHAASAVARLHAFDELGRSLHERDQVLADVAHDLRNSIHSVVLSTAVLAERLEPGSPHRSTVGRIVTHARRATAVVEKLLSSSVIDAGRLVLQQRDVEPAELVLAAIDAQQDSGHAANVLVTAELNPGLRAIVGDREKLLEVFDNLIGNALKFTNPSGTITVGAAPNQDHVLFWVKDTGAGIPKEELPRVFERYWRARSGERKGSGLGLSICKGIVEAHGGRIWAESRPGLGTTMLFELPMAATAMTR